MIVYDFLGTQTVVSGVNSPSSFGQAVGYVPVIETTAYQLNGSAAAFAAVSAAYQNAANQVLSALAPSLSNYGASVAAGFNPVTTAFTANGQGVDAFFDANPETVSGSNNLQLGAGSNPVLSIAFSGSPSASATLGGSAAGNATSYQPPSVGTGGTTSGTVATPGACGPGTYCYAYLGKSITISATVLGQGAAYNAPQYPESCTGTVASTPSSLGGSAVQVATISGTCTINGQTTQLYGYVLPSPINSSASSSTYSDGDPISTYDGLGYSPDSSWLPTAAPQNGAAPTSFSLDASVSIGAVGGTLTVN